MLTIQLLLQLRILIFLHTFIQSLKQMFMQVKQFVQNSSLIYRSAVFVRSDENT